MTGKKGKSRSSDGESILKCDYFIAGYSNPAVVPLAAVIFKAGVFCCAIDLHFRLTESWGESKNDSKGDVACPSSPGRALRKRLLCSLGFIKQVIPCRDHDGNVVSRSMRNIQQMMTSRPVEVAVAPKKPWLSVTCMTIPVNMY